MITKRVSKRSVKFHADLRRVETRILRVDNVATASRENHLSGESNHATPEELVQDAQPDTHVDHLLEELLVQVEALADGRAQQLGELHEVAVELSLVIAAHIIKRELDADQLDLNEIVGAAIEQLLPAGYIDIRVHPDDALDLESIDSAHGGNLLDKIQLAHDASLPRGSCLVANEDVGLFSTLEARLESIRDTLLQGIEYARIERRTAVGIGKSLRRFPDRRQPA